MIFDPTYDNPGDYFAHLANDRAVALEARANAVLAAHEQAATDYTREVETPEWSPFVEMPAGTEVRDFPEGGRLFELAEGGLLTVTENLNFKLVDFQGVVHSLSPEGPFLNLPDGRRFELEISAQNSVGPTIGVMGLPSDAPIFDLGGNRYRIETSEIALLIDHPARIATLVNQSGTLVVIGPEVFGVGEVVTVAPIGDGRRSFRAESGHSGVVDPTGSVRISTATGLDLVIQFENTGGSGSDIEIPVPGPFDCGGFAV